MALRLARLVEISVTLNSTLQLDQLLRFILETAVSLLECEAASIMLYDAEQGNLYFAASTNVDPRDASNIPVPLDRSIAGTILKANRPVIINDAATDPRHYKAVSDKVNFKVKSILGVPMAIQERVTGVLEALNKNQGVFTSEDVEVLSIIASQAAVAIHNAQLVQALKKANEELSLADKLKSDFMAIASHELRTPLGLILGYATFLKEDASGKLSEHAETVLNAALRLQTLVEDMTNMNLLYTGEVHLHLEPKPIQEIIHQAYQSVASAVEVGHHSLNFSLHQTPVYVNADPRLELVFVNILNNALRFTPEPGEINVSMRLDGGDVVVLVKDNGIGIPKEQLPLIFDQFFQVEEHTTRHYGGLGLGLAIARAVVELHRGRIWAESGGPGRGATFFVSIPRVVQG